MLLEQNENRNRLRRETCRLHFRWLAPLSQRRTLKIYSIYYFVDVAAAFAFTIITTSLQQQNQLAF